ncbi:MULTISPECIES: glycosyltransferase [Kribbella]|uniref:glycosyltransferase n=1 Tax=Kribbella TaxID=182639 RepID=UPI00104B2DE1|nr:MULTISPECIES: glycosyltransferase [Kribbella]
MLAAVVAGYAASIVETPVTSDLGLVAVLPSAYWIGIFTLNLVFVLSLRRSRPNQLQLAVLICCLVVVLYGAAALASPVARAEVAWRHLGIADMLLRTGELDPRLDAYFNWPGFFALLAVLSTATGLQPAELALWAPVVNALLWLAALALVVRTLTSDRRLVWLTLWLFSLGNWIDQDYLAPQAFGFFFYLVVLALLLNFLGAAPPLGRSWSWAGRWSWWRDRLPTEPVASRRVMALLVATVLAAAIVISHQLTPFMLLVAVTALVATGRSWTSALPLLIGVMIVLWLAFPASTYLAGHPPLFVSGVEASAAANVSERLAGTAGHVYIVQVRMLLSIAIWILAAAGVVIARRLCTFDTRPIVLAAAPFALLPAQSYGGEMLMRVTLFSLPFTAFLAAGALLALQPVLDNLRTTALVVLCSIFAVASVASRYGNAQFDMFTASELEATESLYELSPAGAMLIAGGHPTPWRYREYEQHRSRTVRDICGPVRDAAGCAQLVYASARRDHSGAMLLLNRAARSSLVMQGVMTMEEIDGMEAVLARRPGVFLVFENQEARIYRIEPYR